MNRTAPRALVPPQDDQRGGDQWDPTPHGVPDETSRFQRSRPGRLTPVRVQLEAELCGIVGLLADDDIDELIDHGIDLWLQAGRRCLSAADPDAGRRPAAPTPRNRHRRMI